MKYEFKIDSETKDIRLDKALKILMPTYSRTLISTLIDEGFIRINNKIVKPSCLTKENDLIVVEEKKPVELDLKPKDMDLKIIYEDDDCAVVYKPEGVVVHPGGGTSDNTLVNGLLYEMEDLPTIKGEFRPGIVHRIDKDTSGLLMIAKNDYAAENLSNQLKEHTVNRIYVAIVYGVISEEMGRIEAPIGRDPNNRKKMAIVQDGKRAITNFKVIERLDKFTVIECKLETGRTHQIRVHMQYIKHPLVGDKVYGPRKVISDHGQFLHAKVIGFRQPKTNEYLEFSCDLPEYFNTFIDEHRIK